jgi:plastocyanin
MGCAERTRNRETSVKAIWLVLALGMTGKEPRGDATVDIRNFGYRSAALEVAVGTRVTWTNRDAVEHTVSFGTVGDPDGTFAGTLRGAGATFSYTFEQAGTYHYFCDRHHFMRGEIRVTPKKEGAR